MPTISNMLSKVTNIHSFVSYISKVISFPLSFIISEIVLNSVNSFCSSVILYCPYWVIT
jgi:hypothetical protein